MIKYSLVCYILLLVSPFIYASVVGDFFDFYRDSDSELSKGFFVVTPHASNTTFFVDNEGAVVGRVTFPGSLWLSEVNSDGSMTGIISPYLQLVGLPGNQTGFHVSPTGEFVFEPDHLFSQLSNLLIDDGYELLTIHHDFSVVKEVPGVGYEYAFLAKAVEATANTARDLKRGVRLPREDFLVLASYSEVSNEFEFQLVSILGAVMDLTSKNLDELLSVRCRHNEVWLHTNSIDYEGGKYYLSLRNINSVGVFNGELALEKIVELEGAAEMHDVLKIEGGYSYFHNGVCDGESQVVFANEEGEVTEFYETSGFSGPYGSVQHLSNGGVLVCNGATGEILEFNDSMDIVASVSVKIKSYIAWSRNVWGNSTLKQVSACYRGQKIDGIPQWVDY